MDRAFTFLKHFWLIISFEFLNFLIQNVADKQRNFSRIFQDWIISFRKADKLIVFLKNKTPLEYTLYQTISDKDEILFRWSKSEKQISSAQRPPPLVAILLKIWESKDGFNNDCLGIMNLLPIFHIKINGKFLQFYLSILLLRLYFSYFPGQNKYKIILFLHYKVGTKKLIKGQSLYYVRVFLNHLPPYVSKFSVHKVHKGKSSFSEPPSHPFFT